MLRFTLKSPYHGLPRVQKFCNSRCLSVRHQDFQKTSQDPINPTNKKEKKQSGSGGAGYLYTIGLLSVATGATIVYAKYDPEFRKWLSQQVPWSDRIIEIVFQEKESWGKVFGDVMDRVSDSTHVLISSFAKKEKSGNDICDESKKEQQEFTPPRSVFSALLTKSNDPNEKPWAEVRVLPEPSQGSQSVTKIVAGEREKGSPKDPASLPETHPLNLVELEKKIKESSSIAVKAYNEALCAVRDANADIPTLIEQTVMQTDEKGLQCIKAKFEKKEILINEAEKQADTATDCLRKLKNLIESENLRAPDNMKATALRNVERVLEDICAAKKKLEDEKRAASITEKYWKKVETARKHYVDELLTLFPDVRLAEKEWKIDRQDLDLFIYYCFQNVLYYQKELAKSETIRAEQLNNCLRGNGEKVDKTLVDATVTEALERQRRDMELMFQKKILEIKQGTEQEMRLQMKRQTEAHNDHLNDVLALREKELERKFKRQEEEKITSAENKCKHQLAGMLGRLQGLEAALKARAHIDKGAHQAQVLWSACQALHCALKHSDPGVSWKEQLKPLGNEIAAVQKAALEDDELVKAVLQGIPHEAKQRGVYSEAALRERFLQVEHSARRLALVPGGGASLPVYLLSYLQNALLIKSLNPIPECELLNEPSNFDKIDTYDVLQRARYWMERGNIEQTLRYMNLLTGASRAVAQEWMTEARIYLETKQAATVLMTHAAAAGLLYV